MIQLEIKRREAEAKQFGTYDCWLYIPRLDSAGVDQHHVVVERFNRSLGAAALLREAVQLLERKL